MRDEARALLDSLTPEQAAEARRPLDDDAERRTWFYFPQARGGVPLAHLDHRQHLLVWRLVGSLLSVPGMATATTIVNLEPVLERMERLSPRFPRDAAYYFTTVFGDPDEPAWGWRFEGHHVCLHVTAAGDEVVPWPLFLGSNPARMGAIRPLGPEEDLARELLAALTPAQRSRAVVDDTAPRDILTTNLPELGPEPEPAGVPFKDLTGGAAAAAAALVEQYAGRLAEPRAIPTDDLLFCWAGGLEPGGPHYYRIQGDDTLIEYDNTQDGANHVHTVWRSRRHDFGGDLLRRHLAGGHPH